MADTKPTAPKPTPKSAEELITSALSDLTTPTAKVVDKNQERRDELEAEVGRLFQSLVVDIQSTLGGENFELVTDEERLAKALTSVKASKSAVVKVVRSITDETFDRIPDLG